MKSTHMFLCAALLVAAIALVATGSGGFAFLPGILCMVMMGGMMFFMMGGNTGNRDK